MNHVTDDYGRTAVAVGAPGSIERAKIERPKLIDRLNSLYFQAYDSPGRAVDCAVEMIRAAGIRSELETASILKASAYGEERPGSVTDLVCSIANAPADLSAVAGKVRRDVGFDFDAAIAPHILRNWDRKRIVVFAKHLLGDECQNCPKPNARPHAPERSDGSVQADVGA
jgi:hypothetical protein